MRVQLLSLLMRPSAMACGQGDKESPRANDVCKGYITGCHRLWDFQP